LSDIEHEFELDSEYTQEKDMFSELELAFEADEHSELDESEVNFEMDDQLSQAIGSELDSGVGKYTNQLYELVDRGFESSAEVDNVVHEVVRQMEIQYFWNPFKKLKSTITGLANSKLGKIVVGAVKQNIPGLKALDVATQMIRNPSAANFRNLLKQSVLSAASSFVPGGQTGVDILRNLGGIPGAGAEQNRGAIENAVKVVRDGYQTLANNIGDQILDPVEAAKLASTSFGSAYEKYSHPVSEYETSQGTLQAGSWGEDTKSQNIKISRNVKKLVIYFE